jgi:hypothetical protein
MTKSKTIYLRCLKNASIQIDGPKTWDIYWEGNTMNHGGLTGKASISTIAWFFTSSLLFSFGALDVKRLEMI